MIMSMSMDELNTLPPDDATTAQLLILIRELRQAHHANQLERESTRQSIDALSREVAKIRQSFDTATTVVRLIKWLAATGVAVIALIEATRRILP